MFDTLVKLIINVDEQNPEQSRLNSFCPEPPSKPNEIYENRECRCIPFSKGGISAIFLR